MNEFEVLRPVELDALREVANIGAGHAANALSQMTRRPVLVTVPRVAFLGTDEALHGAAPAAESYSAVQLEMVGDVPGRTLVLFDAAAARGLCGILLGRPASPDGLFDELERSVLTELANILAGAYVSALSRFLGLMLVPSVPELRIGSLAAVLAPSLPGRGSGVAGALCVETRLRLREDEAELSGNFILIPDADALPAIFRAIRLRS